MKSHFRIIMLAITALLLTIIISSSQCHASDSWYEPTVPLAGDPGWRKWDIKFNLFVMSWKEFQRMVTHYEGQPNPNIVGYFVASRTRIDVYIPMDSTGAVDYDTIGHEVTHVADFIAKDCYFDADKDKCKSRSHVNMRDGARVWGIYIMGDI